LKRAVFLDRDGVINRSLVHEGRPYSPTNINDFEILPGVYDALKKLRDKGYLSIVVTNQPDVKTGKQSLETLEAMHKKLLAELPLDVIKVCTHTDDDNCLCRKPRPGMLLEAAEQMNIDLRASWMVGDRWRDISAGQAVGCICYFIDYGYCERQPDLPYQLGESLSAVVDDILHCKYINQTTK
jgi:D-glycero-D-manno-heptose 1,7-bisphosphate phosphatase